MAEKSKVTIRNTSGGERVFNDVVSGSVLFKAGETKSFEVSSDEADKLKDGRPGWEMTTVAAAAKADKAQAKAEAKNLSKMSTDELANQARAKGVDVAPDAGKGEIVDALVNNK